MNYDICFCANHKCPLRKNCERDTSRLADYKWPVSMAGFKPDKDGHCEHFIKSTKEKHHASHRRP